MNLFLTTILLSLSLAAEGAITVEEQEGESFSVFLDGKLLMEHSSSSPLMTLGTGTFEAVENQGNYDIDDQIDETFPLQNFQIELDEDANVATLTLASASDPDAVGIVLVLTEPTPGEVVVEPDYFAFPNADVNRFFLRLPAEDGEKIFGGGEQYTYLDLRSGPDYPVWVREQGFIRDPDAPLYAGVELVFPGAGGDYHTTYWPQATFLSTRQYYFEFTTPTYSELRFAPADDSERGHVIYWHRTPVQAECEDCQIRFVVRDSLLEIVRAINPGAPEIPNWVYNGAILGLQGGTDAMLQRLQEADDYGVAVSGLWIQDWSGKIVTDLGTRVFWNWRWNETWYPDLDNVIQDLRDRDVRLLTYITGHLNVDGDVYQAAEDQDYWLTTDDGQRLLQDFGQFIVATVDLITPDPNCNCENPARDYYKSLMKQNLLDLGISGWMADFGEYTPTNARSGYPSEWWGETDQEEILHQVYSQEWAKLNRELLEENGALDDVLFFMRSGGVRSKFFQHMSWAGDQTVDWSKADGLKSSIVAALSLATGGMGVSHSDTGGYTGLPDLNIVRSKELLLRWAEYSVFTPVLRTHEGNYPAENHQVYTDEDTWLQFARLTQMYKAMGPYARDAVSTNSQDGIPVMRPLFLDFESDGGAFDADYEYLYGEDLLVAPVTEPDAEEWEVYLPGPQGWVWLWDEVETVLQGPTTVTVAATLGQTPVFYKLGSRWTDLFTTIRSLYSLDE